MTKNTLKIIFQHISDHSFWHHSLKMKSRKIEWIPSAGALRACWHWDPWADQCRKEPSADSLGRPGLAWWQHRRRQSGVPHWPMTPRRRENWGPGLASLHLWWYPSPVDLHFTCISPLHLLFQTLPSSTSLQKKKDWHTSFQNVHQIYNRSCDKVIL